MRAHSTHARCSSRRYEVKSQFDMTDRRGVIQRPSSRVTAGAGPSVACSGRAEPPLADHESGRCSRSGSRPTTAMMLPEIPLQTRLLNTQKCANHSRAATRPVLRTLRGAPPRPHAWTCSLTGRSGRRLSSSCRPSDDACRLGRGSSEDGGWLVNWKPAATPRQRPAVQFGITHSRRRPRRVASPFQCGPWRARRVDWWERPHSDQCTILTPLPFRGTVYTPIRNTASPF